jgi:hypothetical protein
MAELVIEHLRIIKALDSREEPAHGLRVGLTEKIDEWFSLLPLPTRRTLTPPYGYPWSMLARICGGTYYSEIFRGGTIIKRFRFEADKNNISDQRAAMLDIRLPRVETRWQQ